MNFLLNIFKKIVPNKFLDKIRPSYHYFLAYLAAVVYGFPSNKLIVIGITGTAGKTSSVYLMAKALSQAGYKTGYTSTAMFGDGDRECLNDKKMSMPGRFFTQRMLKKMVKNECIYAIIETTSEGIRQFRHRFVNYDILCFTSLYPEHIESHGSFENYKQAKGGLFAHLKKCQAKYVDDQQRVIKIKHNLSKINLNKIKKTIIANGDDQHSSFFTNFWAEDKIVYRQGDFAQQDHFTIFYNNINIDNREIFFDVNFSSREAGGEENVEKRVELSLFGEFNVLNSLPLIALSVSQEIDLSLLIKSLKKINNIPGRIEVIDVGQDFLAIVDYAYEPVALEKLYQTVDLMRAGREKGRLIHILGSAGGGRDKSRRQILGAMAGKKADFVIITNEDPYDENPLDIINQVAVGAKESGKVEGENLFRILSRREAIKKALNLVREAGDIILLTGKGSEQAICLAGGKKEPWDDRLVLKEEIINKLAV